MVCCECFGLKIWLDVDFEFINFQDDFWYCDYVDEYLECVGCKGMMLNVVWIVVCINIMVIFVLVFWCGDVDVMICGLEGCFIWYLCDICQVIGVCEMVWDLLVMLLLINSQGVMFLFDMFVIEDLIVEEIFEMVVLVVEEICCFGIELKVVFLLMFNFGFCDIVLFCKM